MSPIALYDILTLEENKVDKDYTVANMVDYNHATYLYLIEVDKEENLIENNQFIARRVIKDGEESIERVTEEKELQEVARLFFDLFKDMAKEAIDENE